MRATLCAGLLGATALFSADSSALADAVKYGLEPSHSQIVFSYDHVGLSRNWGMFSGFGGEMLFDQVKPALSAVTVSFPAQSLFTG